MEVGALDVQVLTGPKLLVQGRIYAVETDVTPEDLERLARYCTAEAAKLRDDRKEM